LLHHDGLYSAVVTQDESGISRESSRLLSSLRGLLPFNVQLEIFITGQISVVLQNGADFARYWLVAIVVATGAGIFAALVFGSRQHDDSVELQFVDTRLGRRGVAETEDPPLSFSDTQAIPLITGSAATAKAGIAKRTTATAKNRRIITSFCEHTLFRQHKMHDGTALVPGRQVASTMPGCTK
jgi:hypothetical protein